MRRGEMRNQRYGVASERGSKPVRAANRSLRSCGSASIFEDVDFALDHRHLARMAKPQRSSVLNQPENIAIGVSE
jgi:hypothetical protein